MGSSWLIVLVALPWLAAIGAAVLPGRRALLARPLALVASGGMAVVLAWLGPGAMASQGLTSHTAWVPGLGVELALRLDPLSFTLLVNLTLVALAASWYAWGYWAETERAHLAYALMLAFVGGMLGTLLSDDMVLFFVFWESMLISSSLLLAGWGSGPNLGQITLKYVLFTQAGSLCILVVLARIAIGAGSSSLDVVRAWLATLPPAQLRWMEILLLIGFGVKLAIVPLHLWLPDAHSVAPMPITILLAATMLSMGAYGIARFPMEILGLAAVRGLQLPLLILGLVCAFYGALMCFAARDIKRLVAYSSVSQMGYVLFGLAELTPRGVQGALMHLINHGIIKALLFMGVGLIMHATGRRQVERISGLLKAMPGVALGLLLGAMGLAGLPPLAIFFDEWLILADGLRTPYPALGYLDFLSPLLTAAYALWFTGRLAIGDPPEDMDVRPTPAAMRWPFYVLVALMFVVGLAPGPLYRWAGEAARLVLGGAP